MDVNQELAPVYLLHEGSKFLIPEPAVSVVADEKYTGGRHLPADPVELTEARIDVRHGQGCEQAIAAGIFGNDSRGVVIARPDQVGKGRTLERCDIRVWE